MTVLLTDSTLRGKGGESSHHHGTISSEHFLISYTVWVPGRGLGQITCRIVLTKKNWGAKVWTKRQENREIVARWADRSEYMWVRDRVILEWEGNRECSYEKNLPMKNIWHRQKKLRMRSGLSTYWPTLGWGSWTGTPWGGVGRGFGLVPGYTTLSVSVRANINLVP